MSPFYAIYHSVNLFPLAFYSYAIAVRVLLLIEFVANLKLGYSLIRLS